MWKVLHVWSHVDRSYLLADTLLLVSGTVVTILLTYSKWIQLNHPLLVRVQGLHYFFRSLRLFVIYSLF